MSILIGKSQEGGVALDVGYSYKFINKPLNQLYIGAIGSYSKGVRSLPSYSGQVLFGAGVYYGSYRSKMLLMPAVNIGYGKKEFLY